MKPAILLLLICLPFLVLSQASKWHGTNQDMRYPDTNLLNNWENDTLEITTTFSGIGEGYGSPSMNELGLFVAGMQDSTGFIYRFNMNGELIWEHAYGQEFTFKFKGSRGTPTLHDGKLYYSGAFGDAICLDQKTGNEIWHVNIFKKYDGEPIKWGYTESPLIYKDLVILQAGGEKATLCALNKNNGTVAWETLLEGNTNAYSSPKLFKQGDKTFCILNLSKCLVIFNPETGNIVLNHPLIHSRLNHSNEPVILQDKIFYSSGYGEGSVMFKLDDSCSKLDTLWQNTEFDSKLSGIQIVNGLIYGTADKKKRWTVINEEDGKTVFVSRELKPGSFVMADNKFFIFTENGEIALAKPTAEGFDIINSFHSPAYPATYAFAHPVIHQGHLYIRFNNDIWKYKISN